METVLKRIEIQPRDVALFRVLYEHYPLNSPYLFELTHPHFPSLAAAKNRLTDLHKAGYVREVPYYPGKRSWGSFSLWELTARAEQELEAAGHQIIPRSLDKGFDKHDYMAATISASLHIAINEDPTLRFISRTEILYPDRKIKILLPVESMKPDELTALEYREKQTFRMFADECDRSSEDYTRLYGKYVNYNHVITKGIYKDAYGKKCGLVSRFFFTTTSRMQGFLKRVEKWHGGPCSWIIAAVAPEFGRDYELPPVKKELLTNLYYRAGLPPVDIRNPNRW